MDFDYVVTTKPVRKPGTKAKATIIEIREVKASQVYKTGAKNPDQQLFAIIARVGDWEGLIGTIPRPPTKIISAKSRLAQFKQRYKKFPTVGMHVDVLANDAGYWKLVI